MRDKVTGIACGLLIAGMTSPVLLNEALRDTRRISCDVAVSRFRDGTKTEVQRGDGICGTCFADEGNDGIVDSVFDYFVVPKRMPLAVYRPVTEKDQDFFSQATSRFEQGTYTGLRGIYKSIKKAVKSIV